MRVPERSFDPVARGSGFALPRFGQTYFVHASDIAALPIRVGVAAAAVACFIRMASLPRASSSGSHHRMRACR